MITSKIDWFIAKTKRVSVQLRHSVYICTDIDASHALIWIPPMHCNEFIPCFEMHKCTWFTGSDFGSDEDRNRLEHILYSLDPYQIEDLNSHLQTWNSFDSEPLQGYADDELHQRHGLRSKRSTDILDEKTRSPLPRLGVREEEKEREKRLPRLGLRSSFENFEDYYDDDQERDKRLPRLGLRSPLPRLGIRAPMVDKRLPRLGMRSPLPRLGVRSPLPRLGRDEEDEDYEEDNRAKRLPRIGLFSRASPFPRLGDRAAPFPRLGKRSPFPRLGRAAPFPGSVDPLKITFPTKRNY